MYNTFRAWLRGWPDGYGPGWFLKALLTFSVTLGILSLIHIFWMLVYTG